MNLLALLRRLLTSYVLFVVVGIVVGVTLAPVAWNAATAPDGTVAVVPVDGSIDGERAAEVTTMLQQARADPDIDAVVIVANSGGGTAAASETLYLQTRRTAATMPVVASVDATAASGAYYTIVPSDYIYAKPSSVVGSVGVLGTLPQDLEPNGVVATSGPNKLSGGDEREFFAILETLRRAFVGAVFEQRGDRLTLTRAELSQAQVYAGPQAVENGLVDAVGDEQAAIEHAARLANLSDYRVTVLRPSDSRSRFVSRSNYLASTAPHKELVDASYFTGARTGPPVFLMMPGSYVASAESTAVASPATGAATETADTTVATTSANATSTTLAAQSVTRVTSSPAPEANATAEGAR